MVCGKETSISGHWWFGVLIRCVVVVVVVVVVLISLFATDISVYRWLCHCERRNYGERNYFSG